MAQRRTWWLTAAALVVVLIGVGVILLRRGTDPASSSEAACRQAPPPSTAPADDSTGLEVVEKGFSTVGSDPPWASAGTVLRNTTGKVAYRTLVTIDALDAGGRTIVWRDHQLFTTQVVPILLPGASVAVGNALAMGPATQANVGAIASISVTFAVGQWLDAAGGNAGLGPIKTTVIPGTGKREAEGNGSIGYTVESANCAEMKSRGTSMVFRNSAGKLIGGTLNNEPELNTCEPGITEISSTGILQPGIPADADLDRTSVTVYCDFDRPVVPQGSGAPVN